MKRAICQRAVGAAVVLLGWAAAAQGGQGVRTDWRGLIKVPNPLSGRNPTYPLVAQPVPAVGQSFLDARFRTKLTRVTQQTGLRHEYARYDPFNRNQSRIVLIHPESGDIRAYRTATVPYDRKANLLKTLDMEQPRWDPNDADVLWGFKDHQILAVNFRTNQTTVVKDFTKDPTIAPILKAEGDLYRITTRDEGEASRDMRFWALFLQGSTQEYRLRYIFTWDRRTDRVLGLYKLSKEEEVDWVGMSWLGNWVLIGADPGKGRINGLMMADKALTKFHKLDHATAHSDVGLDAQGNEVIVMQNPRTDHIDLIPIDRKTRPVRDADDAYAGTNRTRLVQLFYSDESPLGFGSGIHVSCNVPGWCVISTYTEPKVKEQNWLDRTIVLARLDPRRPAVYYLAKVRGTRGAYWEETHATIANDGSKVLWATNWNQDVGKESAFLMQLDMPPNWQAHLK